MAPLSIMDVGFLGSAGGVTGVTGYWKELVRTELGSDAGLITVSELSTHRYYTYLIYSITDHASGVSPQMRLNNNSNSVYNNRTSRDGASDSLAGQSSSGFLDAANRAEDYICHGYLSNVANEEKLTINHQMYDNGIGASNAPRRVEEVAKFVPSPEADVDEFNFYDNDGGGNTHIRAGSQLIILGWVDTLTHGIADNFWKFLGRTELSVAGDNIEVASFAAKEWLLVRDYLIPSIVSNITRDITFNNDTGNNYADRNSFNGAADVTGINKSALDTTNLSNSPYFREYIIRNQSDKEKLMNLHAVDQQPAGAGNAPRRKEVVGKWINTSSQITTIDLTNTEAGIDYDVGSFIEVWGSN